MGKMKVHELAKDLGLSSKDLIEKLKTTHQVLSVLLTEL